MQKVSNPEARLGDQPEVSSTATGAFGNGGRS